VRLSVTVKTLPAPANPVPRRCGPRAGSGFLGTRTRRQHRRLPALAEGGLGSQGAFVGKDLYSGSSFVYDPWILYARGLITAPNLVLSGVGRLASRRSGLRLGHHARSTAPQCSESPIARRPR
jgi:hypothetical protein